MWAKMNQDTKWKSNDVELLGFTIDDNLRFDKHMSNICLKTNRKLSVLTRVPKFVPFKERRFLVKAFLEPKFNIVHFYGCFMEGKSIIRQIKCMKEL